MLTKKPADLRSKSLYDFLDGIDDPIMRDVMQMRLQATARRNPNLRAHHPSAQTMYENFESQQDNGEQS